MKGFQPIMIAPLLWVQKQVTPSCLEARLSLLVLSQHLTHAQTEIVECHWGGEWKVNRMANQKGITRVMLSRQSLIIIEEILKQIDSNTIQL
jgi:hypothetical protein